MNFYLTLENKTIKKLKDLQVGDRVLCDCGQFYPIKNIVTISCYPSFCRLSNGFNFYVPKRMKIKTKTGFKQLELWDIVEINKDLTPQVISFKNIDRLMFFHDILIDGNMITPEGIVFKYSN